MDGRNHEPKIDLSYFVRETEHGLTQNLPGLLEEEKKQSQAMIQGARHSQASSALKMWTKKERPTWSPEAIPNPSLPKKKASC